MENAVKKIPGNVARTPLEKRVRRMINAQSDGYDNGAEGFIQDLFRGGCVSEMVNELIYYDDTIRFFKRYRKELHTLTLSLLDCGMTLSNLKGWDGTDPLALEQNNQNVLAWFMFEETAHELYVRAGEKNY